MFSFQLFHLVIYRSYILIDICGMDFRKTFIKHSLFSFCWSRGFLELCLFWIPLVRYRKD